MALAIVVPSGPTAAQSVDATVVIKSQHRRLTFPQDVQRIAVGDPKILSAELITSREVLVLGQETGRTSLIVWFSNGSSRELLVSVQRDLSVLERALKLVDPSIAIDSAPDRDAIVLTGTVPDSSAKQQAENIASCYLDAGAGTVPLPAVSSGTPAPDAGGTPPAGAPAVPVTPQPSQSQGCDRGSAKVISLIQQRTPAPSIEEKIRQAIRGLGGEHVTIRLMLRGDVPDNSRASNDSKGSGDTLVLEGRVPNQVALVRVLTVAAQFFAGKAVTADDIHVVADEAGALAGQGQAQSQGAQSQSLGGGGGGGASSSIFGGQRGARLTNQVRTNLGRAKAIEVAGGRILSFIEVTDLPQVRVDIRLVEVNRTKLRAMNPNSALMTSNFRQPSLNPAQSATGAQGDQAARVGIVGAAIQNVLSFLNGGLLNEFQYSGNGLAVDAALALLEREGIAQSLSSPSLTVLSGELAQVQVGGEVPVPTAFSPAFGNAGGNAATPGVFSSVEFVPFGVQLQIRPLVGEDDTITLDVQPLVVTPDSVLTDTIRQSTGTTVATTAFQTRALRTSSRLQDGQVLLIGGLMSNNTSSNTGSTPGLRNAPLIGKLFQSFNHNDQTTELIVVVNPVILRTSVPDVAMWAFPDRSELIRSLMTGVAAPVKP